MDYGLKDLGYHYVILDDCWSAGRNKSNNDSLVANPSKFPNGMKAVGDALHGLGLGFGMYSDAGKYTCGKYAGGWFLVLVWVGRGNDLLSKHGPRLFKPGGRALLILEILFRQLGL